MVRAFGLHPKGRGFESLTAHQFFFWQYHIFPTITHKDQAFRQSVLSLPVDTFSHSNELRPFIPTITLGYSFYSPWLVKFADMIDRKCLEDCLQKCCCGNDRPSCPVRLIVALRRDCKVSWETKTHAVAQLHGSVPEAYGKYRRTFSESDGHWRTTSWIWLERIPLQDDSTCLRRFSNLRKSLADYWPAPTGRRSSTQNAPNCQRTVFACLHCVS